MVCDFWFIVAVFEFFWANVYKVSLVFCDMREFYYG